MKIVLIALLLLCSLLNTAQTNTLVIQGDVVNIRKTADVKGEVVTKVKQSDVLTIIQKDKLDNVNGVQDYWYKVKFGTYNGYVFGHFTSLKLESKNTNSNIEIVEFSGFLFNNNSDTDEGYNDKGRGTFTEDVLDDNQADIWCETHYHNLFVKVGIRDKSLPIQYIDNISELTLKLTISEDSTDFSTGYVVKKKIVYNKTRDVRIYDNKPYYYPFLIDNVSSFESWSVSLEILDTLTKKVLLKTTKILPTGCNPAELGNE